MTIQGDYLGMSLSIDELDTENLTYFKYCRDHDFHLQKCNDCNLLRYPPTTGCPWCASPRATWTPVVGRGEVHSYEEVHHAIQAAFKTHTPYMVLLVDLDTQKGQPSEVEALRVVGNLTTPNGVLAPPDVVRQAGIGSRVRMVFSDVGDGIALPQWTLDTGVKQPMRPWRYPIE